MSIPARFLHPDGMIEHDFSPEPPSVRKNVETPGPDSSHALYKTVFFRGLFSALSKLAVAHGRFQSASSAKARDY
jgi:hypothetical protein